MDYIDRISHQYSGEILLHAPYKKKSLFSPIRLTLKGADFHSKNKKNGAFSR